MSGHTEPISLREAVAWLEMEKRRNAPTHIRFYAMQVVGEAQKREAELVRSGRTDRREA